MSKRPGGFNSLLAKKSRLDQQTAENRASRAHNPGNKNRYLSNPVQPIRNLATWIVEARNAARNFLPKDQQTCPITRPFCEIEARLGVLKYPFGGRQRVTSSGPKHFNKQIVETFQCNQDAAMEPGVSRTHFITWTAGGVSEVGPVSQALGNSEAAKLKQDLQEHEYVETVYTGYSNDQRICYDGFHPPQPGSQAKYGKAEYKDKLLNRDLIIPAANYDLRISCATEKVLDSRVPATPPSGWKQKRIKRRRSYTRRDGSIKWQVDVTEVITSHVDPHKPQKVSYEIETELLELEMLKLINEMDDGKVQQKATMLAQQLWWILQQINPLTDVVNADETLRDHPNQRAVELALAQCGYMRNWMNQGANVAQYLSPIGRNERPSPSLMNVKFPGCMPVNFSRHNIEDIQRSAENGYFLSEKTDGVRHFMIFTGDTAVLVDRAMKGKQPIPTVGGDEDPMTPILKLIKPGTVFDGEVVMHRGKPGKSKPRAVFIVFDVLANSAEEPVMHLPFEQRCSHLKKASFRSASCNSDMFDPRFVSNPSIALPLVRKNFVKRIMLDDLLQHVREERGLRTYRNGDIHNHMTDGIIFQPNLPYTCGTDRQLLKWKYLDTVTIDVEIMPPRRHDDDSILRVACLGDEGSMVDMTRHIHLPQSELLRMHADRVESNCKICEVGFHPETGEWYYLTMRPEKIAPNHISTVLGTILELAESLTTDELRFRMSVPSGMRDTYQKDVRKMLKQLLDFQKKSLKQAR